VVAFDRASVAEENIRMMRYSRTFELQEVCDATEANILGGLAQLSGRHTATNTSNNLNTFTDYKEYATLVALMGFDFSRLSHTLAWGSCFAVATEEHYSKLRALYIIRFSLLPANRRARDSQSHSSHCEEASDLIV